MKRITFIFIILYSSIILGQVKIGDNPEIININSILELESDSKVLVLTRLNSSQINSLAPLPGALVYNTDTQCIYAFDGSIWKNLCNQPNISISNNSPINNAIGDFWLNDSNAVMNIWNGTQWLPININPRRGMGVPDPSITNPLAGDIYVDKITGDLYTYNGSSWITLNQYENIIANNGLNVTSNEVHLGGILNTPTILTTSLINTLAIHGLETTVLDDTNSVVVADNISGVLKKVSVTNIVGQQQVVIIANDGQSVFNPPSPITSINKIDVYRNGIRIAFSMIDVNTIELEPEAVCFAGDEIRIVQIN